MVEKLIQLMKQDYCINQSNQMIIKIVNKRYSIVSNEEKAFDYIKKLFYPNGVNGIYIVDNDTKNLERTIESIHNVKKVDFLSLVSTIQSTWQYKGKVYPVKEGYYDFYEKNDMKCFLQYYTDDTSGEHVILDYDGNYMIFSVDSKYEFMILARFIREIAFRALEDEQYVSFHSSSVEIDGKGYLLIGDSGAGKSTMALTLCKYFGARYISNDRIMVKIQNNEIHAIPFGMPIKINYGTLKTLGAEKHYENWDNIIPMVSKETFYEYKGEHKLNLLPEELKKYLEIESGNGIKVCGILMPSVLNKKKKEISTISKILERNCYYDNEPIFIEDWLALRTKSRNFTKDKILNLMRQLPVFKEEFKVTQFRECAQRFIESIGAKK